MEVDGLLETRCRPSDLRREGWVSTQSRRTPESLGIHQRWESCPSISPEAVDQRQYQKLGSSRPNGDARILGCAALEQREPTTGSARFRESQFRDFGDQLHGGGTKALIRSISSSGVSVIWSALAPCLVTPRIRSLPGTVSTLTKPCAVLSAMARSRSSMPYLVTSCGMFFTLDSCSFRPTGTTSASTEVAQGTTESLTLNFMKPSNKLVHRRIPRHVCRRVGDW